MRHPLFAGMGRDYPAHLEAQFDRILTQIEALWESPQLHDYFSELIVGKRAGRKGFPPEVVTDLMALRDFREMETFRAAERREDAMRQLAARGVALTEAGFLRAFRDGNQELVDLFVRARFPLPARDGGDPLLLAALKRGHTIVARIVLAAGAEPNARDHLGLTPLLVACGKQSQGYRAIVEELIAKGALVNVRDPLGNTPLMLAISGGMPDIAQLLVSAGAALPDESDDGESAAATATEIER